MKTFHINKSFILETNLILSLYYLCVFVGNTRWSSAAVCYLVYYNLPKQRKEYFIRTLYPLFFTGFLPSTKACQRMCCKLSHWPWTTLSKSSLGWCTSHLYTPVLFTGAFRQNEEFEGTSNLTVDAANSKPEPKSLKFTTSLSFLAEKPNPDNETSTAS